MEWNLFNSQMTIDLAFDMDGVLCEDCPPGDDDDGERYGQWMDSVRPLWVKPKRRPIACIITARLEKYRDRTEAWLSRHGIRFKKLVMGPWDSARERAGKVSAWKADQLTLWSNRYRRDGNGPLMYVESDPSLAREINKRSSIPVLCIADNKVHGG